MPLPSKRSSRSATSEAMQPGVGAPSDRRLRSLAIALLLVAATTAVYGQFAGFVWDDEQYVVRNPQVRAGLMSDGVAWACTTAHASN